VRGFSRLEILKTFLSSESFALFRCSVALAMARAVAAVASIVSRDSFFAYRLRAALVFLLCSFSCNHN
jgi:hypothetical protein